jgi:predicted phage baseplate assembly protein
LNSEADAPDFVVETEHDGRASLRFGDDHHGRRPEAGTSFTADYRVGNGRAGNIGAEMLSHVVGADPRITSVRNPLPARGGVEPESAAEVRRRAPQAFRRQERAVTRADYAEVTERYAGVQRAAATPRWTGSWHTLFVTVDRRGGASIRSDGFRDQLAAHVDRYRLAAQDVAFNDPAHVSLELELLVCVRPEYFRSYVRAALLEVLSARRFADGGQGLFHPDRFSFGQTVYLSPIYAAARAVAGVGSVEVTCFQRQGLASSEHLAAGYLKLGRLEVPRLENNPDFPEHGVLRLRLFGGK